MDSGQNYFVFINDKVIKFGENVNNNFGQAKPENKPMGHRFIEAFMADEHKACLLTPPKGYTLKKYFKMFTDDFKNIEAAGGIVRNGKEEVLCIHRLGKWDLPKGKLERGETPLMGAIREVYEECGVHSKQASSFESITYHMYTIKDAWILKKTHWFDLEALPPWKLIPQTEEGISEVCWMNASKILDEFLPKTYPALRYLWSGYRHRVLKH